MLSVVKTGIVTVKLAGALWKPAALATIFAVPFFSALATPVELMLAIEGLLTANVALAPNVPKVHSPLALLVLVLGQAMVLPLLTVPGGVV